MTLCSLPLEIFLKILDFTLKPERLSLCLTSKRLAQVAQPSLFQHLTLHDSTTVTKCFSLVLSRPYLGLAVRELRLALRSDSVVLSASESFWDLIRRGLSCMPNITNLHFASWFLSDIIFCDVTFPQLKTFNSPIYFTPEVFRFLDRHPGITHLFVGDRGTTTLEVSPNLLPSLSSFMGPLSVAEKIVPGRPVVDVTLAWIKSVSEERTTDIIKRFALSTIPIKRFFCTMFHIKENRISLLVAVARYLPHLRLLLFNNFSDGDGDEIDQLFTDTLTSLLPSFKCLERLMIPSGPWGILPDQEESIKLQEKNLTVEWKKSCPKLFHIVFPSCHIYDYDTSVQAWHLRKTPLSQPRTIFEIHSMTF